MCYTGLFLNISSLDYIHFKTKHATRNTVDSSILRFSICCGLCVFVPVEYKAQGCFSMTSEESGFQAELLYTDTGFITISAISVMISCGHDAVIASSLLHVLS